MKQTAPPLATFRNRRGEHVAAASMSATHTKNEFGRVLDMVMQGVVVVITKHAAPKAVMLSVDEFNALALGATRELDTLRDEFDALYTRMQTPEARRAMKTAFAASPRQLGKAAVAAARKRG